MVGNHSLSELRRALTPQGTLVQIGSTDVGLWLRPVHGMLHTLVVSQFVSQRLVGLLADLNQADLTRLSELMASGRLTPVIDRRYRLSEVPEAIRYLEEGHARGKVVITVGDDDAGAAIHAEPSTGFMASIGPELTFGALFVIALGAPGVVALALNRRFQRRSPGKRGYRWGYFLSIQSVIAGFALGCMLEVGVGAAIACGVLYCALAWFSAQRRHWAWITLTILCFNPIAWIINWIYFRRRWTEDSLDRASG